jgi:hypothetical protein
MFARVEVVVGESVGMLFAGLERHQINDVYQPDPEIRQAAAKKIDHG